MKFSKSELDIIYQYAAPTKAETLAGMKEIVPVMDVPGRPQTHSIWLKTC